MSASRPCRVQRAASAVSLGGSPCTFRPDRNLQLDPPRLFLLAKQDHQRIEVLER
jgi:hypothetical protein